MTKIELRNQNGVRIRIVPIKITISKHPGGSYIYEISENQFKSIHKRLKIEFQFAIVTIQTTFGKRYCIISKVDLVVKRS